jgi:hypothetical protein
MVKARAGQDFSAQSLRVGIAQDLMADNVETVTVPKVGGWKCTRKQKAKYDTIGRYHALRHK